VDGPRPTQGAVFCWSRGARRALPTIAGATVVVLLELRAEFQVFVSSRGQCRICCGLRHADHRSASVHAVRKIAKLRRRIGAPPFPFAPIPRHPRGREHYHRMVRRIYAEKQNLVDTCTELPGISRGV